jgi:ferric-chelate reductase
MGNGSVQMDFLTALLDDTELQVISNFYTRSFWFGVVVVIGIATLLNFFLRVRTGLRQVINYQQLCR